jgi:hypothetical protein
MKKFFIDSVVTEQCPAIKESEGYFDGNGWHAPLKINSTKENSSNNRAIASQAKKLGFGIDESKTFIPSIEYITFDNDKIIKFLKMKLKTKLNFTDKFFNLIHLVSLNNPRNPNDIYMTSSGSLSFLTQLSIIVSIVLPIVCMFIFKNGYFLLLSCVLGILSIPLNVVAREYYLNWVELEIKDYKNVPPKYVLDKYEKELEKGKFDYYTIATLTYERKTVKDPLLLGRMHNSSIRYIIAQWDDDIIVDDLI